MINFFSGFHMMQTLIALLMIGTIVISLVLYSKNNKKEIADNGSKNKLFMLILVVAMQCLIITLFWNQLAPFGKEHNWLKSIYAPLFIAVPGYMMWYWRDKHKESDIKHTKKDLNIKEQSADWDNYFKWIEIASDETKSDNVRASAIQALATLYNKEPLTNQVHLFYKNFLNQFWNDLKLSNSIIIYLKECEKFSNIYGQVYQKIEERIEREDALLSCFGENFEKEKNEIKNFSDLQKLIFEAKSLIFFINDNKIPIHDHGSYISKIAKKLPLYIKTIHEVLLDQLERNKKLNGSINLSFSRIELKDFSKCELNNISFKYSILFSNTFKNCIFDGTSFRYCYFNDISFENNNFNEVEINKSFCYYVSIQKNHYTNSFFRNSTLKYCQFKDNDVTKIKSWENIPLFFENCSVINSEFIPQKTKKELRKMGFRNIKECEV
ncbi:hypothetical protein AAEX28_13075 [Lentisphaerota bacterium WC36G]|nr:pentapeptide repeat-containing protein [Lentisphaerae bacterium WC36]